jgi:PAS domain S-box-containing protein
MSSRAVAVQAPIVVTIPSSDVSFQAAVEAALQQLEESTPSSLEASVRRVYPRALVAPREISAEPLQIWYSYRDGRFTGSGDSGWADAPGVAWARVDSTSGTIVDANEALCALFAPGESMVGRNVLEFVPADAAGLSKRQMAAIASAPQTVSVGEARRIDGSTIVVEYVARVTEGLIDAWYREIRDTT